MEVLPVKEQECIRSHEYNEVAKLFFREKKFKESIHYVMKSKRPLDFIWALLTKPFKCLARRIKIANKKTRIVRGW